MATVGPAATTPNKPVSAGMYIFQVGRRAVESSERGRYNTWLKRDRRRTRTRTWSHSRRSVNASSSRGPSNAPPTLLVVSRAGRTGVVHGGDGDQPARGRQDPAAAAGRAHPPWQLQGRLQEPTPRNVLHFQARRCVALACTARPSSTLNRVSLSLVLSGIRALQKGLISAYWYQVFMNGTRLGLFDTMMGALEPYGNFKRLVRAKELAHPGILTAPSVCASPYCSSTQPTRLVRA